MEDRGECEERELLLFDGRLKTRVPGVFKEMEAEKAELIYPYENRPQIILEDEEAGRLCTFSLLKGQKLTVEQVEGAISSIASAVYSLFPSGIGKRPELVKRKTGNYGWFSFITAGKEGKLMNYMYVFPVDGSMMLGTVCHMTEDLEGERLFFKVVGFLENPEKMPSYRRDVSIMQQTRQGTAR